MQMNLKGSKLQWQAETCYILNDIRSHKVLILKPYYTEKAIYFPKEKWDWFYLLIDRCGDEFGTKRCLLSYDHAKTC